MDQFESAYSVPVAFVRLSVARSFHGRIAVSVIIYLISGTKARLTDVEK